MLGFLQELYEGLTCNEDPGPITWPDDPNFKYRPVTEVLQENKLRNQVTAPTTWERKLRFGTDLTASYATSNGEDASQSYQSKQNSWERKVRIPPKSQAGYGDDANMILSNDSTSSGVPLGNQQNAASASGSSSSQARVDHTLHSDFFAPDDRRWRRFSTQGATAPVERISSPTYQQKNNHSHSLFQPTRQPRDFSTILDEDDEDLQNPMNRGAVGAGDGQGHGGLGLPSDAQSTSSDFEPTGRQPSCDEESNGPCDRKVGTSNSKRRAQDITTLWPEQESRYGNGEHDEISPSRASTRSKREEKLLESCMMNDHEQHAPSLNSGSRMPNYGFSNTVKEEYLANSIDMLDKHVAYYFRNNPEVWQNTTFERLEHGKYLINRRNVIVEWFFAELDTDEGYLVVRDGPLVQPFCNYVNGSAENEKYESRDGMENSRISQVPRERRISFSDKDMIYTRLEAMRVAKEQAKIRDQAADRFKKTGEFKNNDELVKKYQVWHQTALKQSPPPANPNPSIRS